MSNQKFSHVNIKKIEISQLYRGENKGNRAKIQSKVTKLLNGDKDLSTDASFWCL